MNERSSNYERNLIGLFLRIMIEFNGLLPKNREGIIMNLENGWLKQCYHPSCHKVPEKNYVSLIVGSEVYGFHLDCFSDLIANITLYSKIYK